MSSFTLDLRLKFYSQRAGNVIKETCIEVLIPLRVSLTGENSSSGGNNESPLIYQELLIRLTEHYGSHTNDI